MKTDSRPPKTVKLFLGILIPVAVGAVFWYIMEVPRAQRERIIENGIHVPGRLLSVEETGARINKSDELELVIEFQRKDGVLDTSATDFVPARRLQRLFVPGAPVTVAYNSANPDEIALVTINTGQ